MLTFLLVLIVLSLVFGAAYCFYRSCNSVGEDEVGVVLRFGKPQGIFQSGFVFVIWTPIKLEGRPIWELLRITKERIQINFKGEVLSSDTQKLLVDVSLYLRFPYKHQPSMFKLVENKVPTTPKGLQDWAEEEVMTVVRNEIATRDYKTALSRDQLDSINAAANVHFDKKEGLFYVSGICGEEPTDKTDGTGLAYLRIKSILPTATLLAQLEAVQTAILGVQVAESAAKQKVAEAGALDQMMEAWVGRQTVASGKTVAQVLRATQKDGSYERQMRTYKDLLFAGDNDLTVVRYEVGAPDGTKIDGNLPAAVAFAAVMRGQGQQDRRGGGKSPGKKGDKPSGGQVPDSSPDGSGITDEEVTQELARRKKGH